MMPVPLAIPAGRAGLSLRFDMGTLSTHAFYLAETGGGRGFLHVDPEGVVHQPGRPPFRLAAGGELLVTPSGTALFLDGAPQDLDVDGWECFWVTQAAEPPRGALHAVPQLAMADDFMRTAIEDHSYCRVSRGSVTLAKHGGGMPTSAWQAADADFQRAVNPFSVFARGGGTLTYTVPGPADWGDVLLEARFYFGVPKTGNVVDLETLPADTDMLVVQGTLDGLQAAFGWRGSQKAFCLMTRRGAEPWVVLAAWDGSRPPLTNWVRIGLAVTRGSRLEGLLDGATVLRAAIPGRVTGPLHVCAGEGLAEFDDVGAWTLPREEGPGTPLYVRSRTFAGKHTKGSSDPPQFEEWANSASAFLRARWHDRDRNAAAASLTTAMPLMGDFAYAAVERADSGGDLPPGPYAFLLLPPPLGPPGPAGPREPVAALAATRTEAGWRLEDPPLGAGPEAAAELPGLALARSRETDWRLAVQAGGRWVPVSGPVPGPVHFSIVRRAPEGQRLVFPPSPAHHVLHCRNLVHEFFEQAPTDWNWFDGAFRMDCRWACQNQWNFMACGSPALPAMAGKRRFDGDQVHEYFICLRSTFPWDAGDASFVYDPEADQATGFQQIQAHHGWYNRRDLNFSFCCDGRNPLSGYSVVFGGDDNRETRLLRRGEVLAATREPRFLFPTSPEHTAVHWNWWKFTVSRLGAEILVRLNDAEVFRVTDPEPLPGGHIAFWSVRNGFGLARLSSMAERISWTPHEFYVSASAQGPWKPLRGGAVCLSPDPETPGLTRVTNQGGGGFFAVRWTPAAPVDLSTTPVLELPLRLGPGAVVNLHLSIGGSAFLLRLGETPLGATKALLTPEAERGECFQLPDIPVRQLERWNLLGTALPEKGVLRADLAGRLAALGRPPSRLLLSAITIGNSSNEGYLLAGRGGNEAGAWYSVGVPAFRPGRNGP